MKISRYYFFFLLSLCGFAVSLSAAAKVVPVKLRSDLIAKTEGYLSSHQDYDYEQIRQPFSAVVEEVVVEEVVVEEKPMVVEVKQELTEQEVLQAVASRIKTKGSINVNGSRILLLANGIRMSEGSVIPVRLQGNIYKITLDNFSDRGFTLTLGQASLLQTLAK